MSHLGILQAGSRHDLRFGLSPDAPDETKHSVGNDGSFGYVHSYETSSRYDGPGLRLVLFVSGCLLRCAYCHNPDTWHLKDGTRVSTQDVIRRLESFAGPLRALRGGLTISGGEPMVQAAFTGRILKAAQRMGLHTAIETSGFLGDLVDDEYLDCIDLVILDIKSFDPTVYLRATERKVEPTLRFAKRLEAMGKPVWVRFTLVPGLTDDPANIDGLARFVAPMKNVEWLEVQPFHQLGAFKWKALDLEYRLQATSPPTSDLISSVIEQFRNAGCNAR